MVANGFKAVESIGPLDIAGDFFRALDDDHDDTPDYHSRESAFALMGSKAGVSLPSPGPSAYSRPSGLGSRPASSHGSSRVPSRIPSRGRSSHPLHFSPGSSIATSSTESKGKRIRLDLDETMSQMSAGMESSIGSDGPSSRRLALSMEKGHQLGMKLKHIDNEHQFQLACEKMQFETTNAHIIHQRFMENKEAEIRLEEAKAMTASNMLREKMAKAEILCRQLMMKGINLDASKACPLAGAGGGDHN